MGHITKRSLLAAPALLLSSHKAFAQAKFGQFMVNVPSVTATFDPNNTGANLTLSNGNLTFAGNGGGGGVFGTVSTTTKTSGKWYFEFVDTHQSGGAQYIGIAVTGFSLTSQNTKCALVNYSNTGSAQTTGFFDGAIYTVNNTNLPAGNPTTTIGWAADLTNGNLWVAFDNTWGGANPSTGGSALYTFTPASAVTYIMGAENAVLTNAVTLQSKASSLTFTPPTGFTAWG